MCRHTYTIGSTWSLDASSEVCWPSVGGGVRWGWGPRCAIGLIWCSATSKNLGGWVGGWRQRLPLAASKCFYVLPHTSFATPLVVQARLQRFFSTQSTTSPRSLLHFTLLPTGKAVEECVLPAPPHLINCCFTSGVTGKAAEASLNVFYYLTYEGSVELEAIQDADMVSWVGAELGGWVD